MPVPYTSATWRGVGHSCAASDLTTAASQHRGAMLRDAATNTIILFVVQGVAPASAGAELLALRVLHTLS
jgi:hypothetical protein